jgi:hypothetical protein
VITSWQITETLAREHVRDLMRAADRPRPRAKTRERFGRRAEPILFVHRLCRDLAGALSRMITGAQLLVLRRSDSALGRRSRWRRNEVSTNDPSPTGIRWREKGLQH